MNASIWALARKRVENIIQRQTWAEVMANPDGEAATRIGLRLRQKFIDMGVEGIAEMPVEEFLEVHRGVLREEAEELLAKYGLAGWDGSSWPPLVLLKGGKADE